MCWDRRRQYLLVNCEPLSRGQDTRHVFLDLFYSEVAYKAIQCRDSSLLGEHGSSSSHRIHCASRLPALCVDHWPREVHLMRPIPTAYFSHCSFSPYHASPLPFFLLLPSTSLSVWDQHVSQLPSSVQEYSTGSPGPELTTLSPTLCKGQLLLASLCLFPS